MGWGVGIVRSTSPIFGTYMNSTAERIAEAVPTLREAAPPREQYGRTGMLVRLGAYAFAAALVVAGSLMDWGQDDVYAVCSVAGSSYLILMLWSGVLAIRALKHAERAIWPILIAMCFLLDLSIFLTITWIVPYGTWAVVHSLPPVRLSIDVMYWLALPVLVPFALGVTLAGVPLAFWIVRRFESRAKEPWPRAKRWKAGTRVMVLVTLLAGLTVLPVPLFVFCAIAPQSANSIYYSTGGWRFERKNSWRHHFAQSMPQWVKDAGGKSLELLDPLTKDVDLLVTGRRLILADFVSVSELKAALTHTDPTIVVAAFAGLKRSPGNFETHIANCIIAGTVIPMDVHEEFLIKSDRELVVKTLSNLPNASRAFYETNLAFAILYSRRDEAEFRSLLHEAKNGQDENRKKFAQGVITSIDAFEKKRKRRR